MRIWLAIVVMLLVALATAGEAGAETITVGELTLTPNGGNVDDFLASVPVFQGDASGNYALSASHSGTITSWSFLSAGAAPGEQYALRVLAPVGMDGTQWEGAGTSATVSVTTQQGVDAVNGPFTTNLPIAAGDRIALEPIASGDTPIETGVVGEDGYRTFSSPFSDGSTVTLDPGSSMDNGQVVPIQATVQYTPALAEITPPVIYAGSNPAGYVRDGEVVTCHPGTYNVAPASQRFNWFWSETTYARKGAHGVIVPVTSQTGLTVSGQTITMPDLPGFNSPSGRYAPTSTVFCVDTASEGADDTISTQSAPVRVAPMVPVLATRQIARPRKKSVTVTIQPPSISKGVGAGGTNSCSPGAWLHFPTRYTYSWWWASPKSKSTKGYHLRHIGQTYKPTTADEGLRLACYVVAYNDAGAARHQISNTYIVPSSAPKSTSPPVVTMSTDDPHRDAVAVTGSTHAVLPGYGNSEWAYFTTIAEKVFLSCDPGGWNRSDLSFRTNWFVNGQATDITGDTVGNDFVSISDPYDFTKTVLNTSTLRFNFTPDNTQEPTLFDGTVSCTVIATTPQGRSSAATSLTLRIWNGCDVGIEQWDQKILREGPLCGDYAPFYSNSLRADVRSQAPASGSSRLTGSRAPAP